MATLAELLRDKRFREDVGNNTRDFFQSASNTAAANVALPIDAISWLLRKGGVPIPEAPVFSSQWAKNAGLMAEPKDPKSLASLMGDAAGNIAPMVGYAKAPEIAGGLNQLIKNANAPATLNTPGWRGQRGAIDPGAFGLVKNPDGTISLFHGTTEQGVTGILKDNALKSAGEPNVYLTTAKDAGYGNKLMQVDVDPRKLFLDDEFPGGRFDFSAFLNGGKFPIKNPKIIK